MAVRTVDSYGCSVRQLSEWAAVDPASLAEERVRHFWFLSYAAKRTYADIRSALAGRSSALTAPEPPISPLASDLALTPERKPTAPHKHCCPRCNIVMKFGEFWPADKVGRGPPGYAPKPGEVVQRSLGLAFTA